MTLTIPELPEDVDPIKAGIEYTKGGWYIGPVAKGTKHPGSILGERWHQQTSQDPQQIVDWFAGTDHGIFLHVGRSGGIVFDVDHPEKVPAVLRESFLANNPPYQETRPDEPRRGHYVYTVPVGRTLGNGTGQLGKGWGEIRGLNGVIIVEPTQHPDGGRYRWAVCGPVPTLPESLAVLLPDASPGCDAATDARMALHLAGAVRADRPDMLSRALRVWEKDIKDGGSRHDITRDAACWLAREAMAGYYPLALAFGELQKRFISVLTATGNGRTLSVSRATAEFKGIAAWAIGQAETEDLTALRFRIDSRPYDPFDPMSGPPPPEYQATNYQPLAMALPVNPAMNSATASAGSPSAEEFMAQALRDAREARIATLAEESENRMRANEIAKYRISGERLVEPPAGISLREALEIPDEPIAMRIESLLIAGGKVVLTAQRKTGKTTMVNNLIRCLADGGRFLDKFIVVPPKDNIVVMDFEMSPELHRFKLRQQKIASDDRVILQYMRGHGRSFNILDDRVRSEWAAKLRDWNCGTLIIDCLRPILDAIGLEEGTQAGRFVEALDALAMESGHQECILVHHAGHAGERSRGDSRLRDWPDSEWKIVRQAPENPTEEPGADAPRFFSAEIRAGYGNGVPESKLNYSDETGRLFLEDGNRHDDKEIYKLNGRIGQLIRTLEESGNWMSGNQLVGRSEALIKAKDIAVERGLIIQIQRFGKGGGQSYGLPAWEEPPQPGATEK